MDLIAALKRVFFTAGSSAASADSRVPILDANGNAIGSDKMTNILGAGSLLSAAKSIVSALTSRTGTSTTAAQGQNLYVPLYNDSGEVVNKIAITELAAFAAGNASVIIPNDTDFDTIQTYGLRSVKNTEAARTMTNIPVITGGLLIVLPIVMPSSQRCSQIFMANTGDVTIFIRRKISDTTWGSWAEIAKVSQ